MGQRRRPVQPRPDSRPATTPWEDAGQEEKERFPWVWRLREKASATMDLHTRPARWGAPAPTQRDRSARAEQSRAATWLILPVVICLSQRLSHACLSINCFIL